MQVVEVEVLLHIGTQAMELAVQELAVQEQMHYQQLLEMV
jgi:hypothetical protein